MLNKSKKIGKHFRQLSKMKLQKSRRVLRDSQMIRNEYFEIRNNPK